MPNLFIHVLQPCQRTPLRLCSSEEIKWGDWPYVDMRWAVDPSWFFVSASSPSKNMDPARLLSPLKNNHWFYTISGLPTTVNMLVFGRLFIRSLAHIDRTCGPLIQTSPWTHPLCHHWNACCERHGQDETNFLSDPVKVLAALPEAEPDGSGVTVLWHWEDGMSQTRAIHGEVG